jgi:outer membrane protein assembly factor BamD
VVTEFPRDPAAVGGALRVCDAYYRLSPRAQLDQQHTHTAITYCQSYAELYPQTPEAATARERVVEMHDKLAHKAYLNGLFYFRRNFLDSSLVYFGQVVETYPDTHGRRPPWR